MSFAVRCPMIVCFNCTAPTKDALDQLVEIGSYRDYGEAIAAAVRNQLLMEKEVREKGAIVIGGPPAPVLPSCGPAEDAQPSQIVAPSKAAAPLPPKPTPLRKENGTGRTSRNGVAVPPKPTGPATVPALFRGDAFPQEPPVGLADFPADMWAPGQAVPLDRWILGQQ